MINTQNFLPNEEYITDIKNIIECDNIQTFYTYLKRNRKDLFDYILNWSINVDLKTFSERAYWAINKMTSFPLCENCGKPLTSKQFEHITNGYRRHYSRYCAYHNPLSKERRQATNMRIYGTKENLSSRIVREKMEQTNLEKYGAKNPFASEEIKGRIKKYWVDNFGVENPNQLQRVKDLQKSHRAESKRKEYETKRRNNSFNKSKPEDDVYELLCNYYVIIMEKMI